MVMDCVESIGIGRQSLYDPFGDKRRLYLEALRRYNSDSVSAALEHVESAPTALKRIENLLLDYATRKPAEHALGCMGINSICEFGTGERRCIADGIRKGTEEGEGCGRSAGIIAGARCGAVHPGYACGNEGPCKGRSERTGAQTDREVCDSGPEDRVTGSQSFGNDSVSPLNQSHKDRRIAELCVPGGEIGVRNTARTAACTAGVNLNFLRNYLVQRFGKRWPTDGHNGLGDRRPHQRHCFAQEKDLHFVPRLGERVSMQERKRGLGRVIRAPCTLHHDLERALLVGCSGDR